ncbi:MAG: alanine dehydrogenase [Polyangiaceae bacterium]
MIIGVPRETKTDEFRIALKPAGAELLVRDGHRVLIEAGAGQGSGFSDDDFRRTGAVIVGDAERVFGEAELLVKVKEPQPREIELLTPRHTVFGYMHFAGSRELTERCLAAGFTAIAYETLADPNGNLPLLTPMSEVAGRLSVQEGAKYLERPFGGRGVLLGGVPGVDSANVLVIGGGVVGSNAARMAAGLGAHVTLLDVNLGQLRYLSDVMPANVSCVYSDKHAIDAYLAQADLVIGAVLLPGRKAPKLISKKQIATMQPGSVIVDVSIDQGGCLETSEPTTHSKPTFVVDGVVHYCVANMPAAVSRTSTHALCNATLPYVRKLASLGSKAFVALDRGHATALNMLGGKIVNHDVADAFEDLPRG